MIKLCLQCADDHIDQARFVFQTVFSVLGIPFAEIKALQDGSYHEQILICYGPHPVTTAKNSRLIFIREVNDWSDVSVNEARLVADRYRTRLPSNIKILFQSDIPEQANVLYTSQKNTALISVSDLSIFCAADLVASAYYMLSLQNERRSTQRDRLNRFHKKYSHLSHDVYDIPIVDGYYKLFSAFIHILTDGMFRPKNLWPHQKVFALVLSHDVDSLATWSLTKIKRTLQHGQTAGGAGSWAKRSVDVLSSLFDWHHYTGNFDFIIKQEASYTARSTFYLAAKHRNRIDPDYSLKWNRIQKGIDSIRKNQCNIGLHGSIPSSENAEFLMEEKHILEQHTGVQVSGNRQHYLRFDIHQTFDIIEEAGFLYDSTVGFDSELGYRCGTALPFRPYSEQIQKPYSFWELPLILMDTVLLLESNLGLSGTLAWDIVRNHLEFAHRNGTCLTMNWHNTVLSTADYWGYTSLYLKILNWALENNAWICSCDDLIYWWADRVTSGFKDRAK